MIADLRHYMEIWKKGLVKKEIVWYYIQALR